MESNIFGKFSPFDITAPEHRRVVTHPLPPSKFFGDFKRPLPTNTWWGNLIVGSGEQTLNTFPYIHKVKSDKYCFVFPKLIEDKNYVLSNYLDEWCVDVSSSTGHKIIHYDELSVTVQYNSDEGSDITIPIVQGSPFVVVEYNNCKPIITTIMALLEVKDENGKSYSPTTHPTIEGSKFIIRMNNDHIWVVYFSSQVKLEVDLGKIQCSSNFKGTMKFAYVEKEEKAAILEKYKNTYAAGAKVEYSTNAISASIRYKWDVKGEGDFLMLAMPHHMQVLLNPNQVREVSYDTIRGRMIGIEGSQWICQESLPEYAWDSPTDPEKAKIADIKEALEIDYKGTVDASDPYFFGVMIGRLAKLALIADKLEETEKAEYLRQRMMEYLEPWLLATNPNELLYDQSYGGIVSKNSIADKTQDFGNGYYNDHHFHYGYHVFASAVIGRKHPEFVEKHKSAIVAYARDYANPSSEDTYFPITIVVVIIPRVTNSFKKEKCVTLD